MIITALLIPLLAVVVTGQVQVQQPCYSCAQQQVGCATCATAAVQVPVPLPAPAKTVELTCEPGFILQNGYCVRKMDISCPAGSRLEGGRCVIVRTEAPICPLGSEMRDGRCVRIYEHVCPSGFNMVNGQCVRSEAIPFSCPPGSFLQNNECVKVECPKNYRLENGWCVAIKEEIITTPSCQATCPSGYYYQNNACYPSQPTIIPQVPVAPVQPCAPIIQQPIVPIAPPPPPPRQVECSQGYVLRNNECVREEIICPEGTYRRGDRCERIACPPPSIWNGEFCMYQAPPQPQPQPLPLPLPAPAPNINTTNIVNNTHTIHNFNNVTHDTNVNVNNVNNVYIYKGGEVVQVSNGTTTRIIEHTVAPPIDVPAPAPEPCCTVVSPRMCKQVNSKWRCFNRQYQRCGSFCSQPIIQLRPQRPVYRRPILVMPPTPPMEPNCGSSGCGGQLNCSGCQTGGYCSPECYQYSCGGDCSYQDQQSFCSEYGGPGCGPEDACCS